MRKTCTKCGEEKEIEEFYKDRTKRDGTASNCKACKKVSVNRWNERNQERKREYRSRYYKATRNHALQKGREWRERNHEYGPTYRDDNKDYINRSSGKEYESKQRTTTQLATKRWRRWDTSEDQFLMEENGMTQYRKAVALGRSYSSVASRVHVLRYREST